LGRILAIDYGKKRTGLAVSDPFRNFAVALNTIATKDFWKFLEKYMAGEKVTAFVVGDAKTMSNLPSESMAYIRPFVEVLRKKYPDIPVDMVDERFTSVMAMQSMIDGGIPKMKRREKERIDQISAVLILQTYLDLINRKL
jgi:putative holliday junction resolvase